MKKGYILSFDNKMKMQEDVVAWDGGDEGKCWQMVGAEGGKGTEQGLSP